MKDIKISENLKEVTLLFLKIGAFSFGGPAAYIAIMQREVVRKRHWLDDQDFLDIVGAVNLVPGPNATQIAMYLGLRRAGWRGFLSSGILFIVPGALATLALAWVYVQYGSLPQVGWVLYGVKPVVIAIVLVALYDLGKKAVKGIVTAAVGIAALALYLLGVNEILLIFAGAAVVVLVYSVRRFGWKSVTAIAGLPVLKMPLSLTAGAVGFSQLTLFLSF